jgi:hypothetical protein
MTETRVAAIEARLDALAVSALPSRATTQRRAVG